jgi:hypothetical protein
VDFEHELNGFYALRAVRAACVDVIHPAHVLTPINIELTELEIDPDDFDPHFLASCIMARGAPWESSSDPNLRREFWINWLENLFPVAFSEPTELLELVKA